MLIVIAKSMRMFQKYLNQDSGRITGTLSVNSDFSIWLGLEMSSNIFKILGGMDLYFLKDSPPFNFAANFDILNRIFI